MSKAERPILIKRGKANHQPVESERPYGRAKPAARCIHANASPFYPQGRISYFDEDGTIQNMLRFFGGEYPGQRVTYVMTDCPPSYGDSLEDVRTVLCTANLACIFKVQPNGRCNLYEYERPLTESDFMEG
jgi:hypothetical protein